MIGVRNIILMATVTFYPVLSNAADTVGSTASNTATQRTIATGTATNAGNSQSITFTSPPDTTQRVIESGTQLVKNTPNVSGPNLISSNDTCMGSTSGSVNIAGLGVGGGTSWTDTNCKMLKNSRELWNMGMHAAALALMCTDTANREALELTGFTCPQTVKARQVVETR